MTMATRYRISVAQTMGAAVAAWVALNVFAYVAAPLLGVSFGATGRFFGSFLFPAAAPAMQVLIGRIIFFGAALGWGLVYRHIVHFLSGPGWLRGLTFGAGVWVISGLLLPVLAAVHPGIYTVLPADMVRSSYPGLFGIGFAGLSGVVLSVLAHLVYGVTLGSVINVKGPTTDDTYLKIR